MVLLLKDGDILNSLRYEVFRSSDSSRACADDCDFVNVQGRWLSQRTHNVLQIAVSRMTNCFYWRGSMTMGKEIKKSISFLYM
jgi:hypothetical protein